MSNDPKLIRQLRDLLGRDRTLELPHGLRPGEVSAVIGSCPMAITMRLHGAILSVRNATPFVALEYDPKVGNVLANCGLRQFVAPMPTEEAKTQALSKMLDETWSARVSIRALLSDTAEKLAARAAEHVERLAAAVLSPRRRITGPAVDFLSEVAGEQLRRLAEADEKARQSEAAEATLRSAISELIGTGCGDAALRLLESWRPNERPAKAHREYHIAFCLHTLGRNAAAALDHYTAALQLGFDEFWILYHRGQLLFGLGERDQALRDMRRAVGLRPEHTGAAGLLAEWSGATKA